MFPVVIVGKSAPELAPRRYWGIDVPGRASEYVMYVIESLQQRATICRICKACAWKTKGWIMSLFRVSLRKSFIVLGVALLLLTVSLSSSSDSAHAGPGIDVGDFWFCGPSFQGGVCGVTVPVGTLVTWTWVGIAPHNTVGPGWASPIQTSGTFTRLFDTEGEFSYLCTVHPLTMNGTIIVSGAAVGGIAELPSLRSTSQLAADVGGDRSVLIGAIVAAALVVCTAVIGAGWLALRKRA